MPEMNFRELNVLLRGNRLEIVVDVDLAGLAKLKMILAKYEEILELLDPDEGRKGPEDLSTCPK